jgi:AcrR family transcriptional regulator
MAPAIEHHPDTRKRILDAARALFAERGYDGASVRDITAEARCNVASVNYHFRGKDGLYREMFERLLGDLRRRRVSSVRQGDLRLTGPLALERLIRKFAGAFLEPLVEEPRGSETLRLISREIIDPHLPPGLFMTELMRPVEKALGSAIRDTGYRMADARLLLCIHSLIAQLVHAARRRKERSSFGAFPSPRVMDHIVRFTAAGIRSFASGQDKRFNAETTMAKRRKPQITRIKKATQILNIDKEE